MKIEFWRHYVSTETRASLDQVADLFQEQFNNNSCIISELNAELNDSEVGINFAAALNHPISSIGQKPRRSFAKSLNTYFLDVQIDYISWIDCDWKERVLLYQLCLVSAISLLPKSKFNTKFKEKLVTSFEAAGEITAKLTPTTLTKVLPIYLCRDSEGKFITISYDLPNEIFGWNVEIIEPSDAHKWIGKSPFRYDDTSFVKKFYKKNKGIIEYREIWYDGTILTRHYGVCGHVGDTTHEEIDDPLILTDAKLQFEQNAAVDHFKELKDSELQYLVIEYDFGDEDPSSMLKRRHEMEDEYNNLIGWRGLGHVDGGSIGATSIEIALRVVDFEIAKKSVIEFTKGTSLGKFSRIKHE